MIYFLIWGQEKSYFQSHFHILVHVTDAWTKMFCNWFEDCLQSQYEFIGLKILSSMNFCISGDAADCDVTVMSNSLEAVCTAKAQVVM